MRPLVAHCHLGLGKLYSRASARRNSVASKDYPATANQRSIAVHA
jgi:hypothetical protein